MAECDPCRWVSRRRACHGCGIFYYSNVLWQAVGFGEDASKSLLLIGSTGMAITLGTMAVIFGTANTHMVDGKEQPFLGGTTGPSAANLFAVSFGMAWGPVVWVLLGEMVPNRI